MIQKAFQAGCVLAHEVDGSIAACARRAKRSKSFVLLKSRRSRMDLSALIVTAIERELDRKIRENIWTKRFYKKEKR